MKWENHPTTRRYKKINGECPIGKQTRPHYMHWIELLRKSSNEHPGCTAYANYSPAWCVCKQRSGQFSSCARIYAFFQVSGHYQTAQWANEWARELNICHCSLQFSLLGLEIADSLSTVPPLWEPAENLFWLGGSLNQTPCAKECPSLSPEIAATSKRGRKKCQK